MMGIRIEFVYQKITTELKSLILDFWKEEETFQNEGVAAKRVEQVVAIAWLDDKIIGLSSGVIGTYESMNQRFLFYRSFIAKNYRSKGLAKNLFNEVYDQFAVMAKEKSIIGIFVSFENELLNKVNRAIVTECRNLTFIGFNENGFQLRVAYFENAILSNL